jgi:GNAT superfamily N-acetyltransferase
MSTAAPGVPPHAFANPAWHALHGLHRHFAMRTAEACRYPADVAPFGAVASPGAAALKALRSLLLPGESIWLFGEHEGLADELRCAERLECLQMLLEPGRAPAPKPGPRVRRLTAVDASAMVRLTDLAFPGFFRKRTCAMGSYYGVFEGDALIAMGGERLMLEGLPEISGVCTHPDYRGQGYAQQLIGQLMREHQRDALRSWLHVGAANVAAIALYERLGFRQSNPITLSRLVTQGPDIRSEG